ncbi:MAG: mevalonate kinase, partial [Chloroflexi bacterium]
MVEASAPAKVILFGEHAVVYGKPAIAVPVSSLRVNVRVIESEQDGIAIVTPLLNEVLRVDDTDVDNNPLVTAVRYTLDALQIQQANLTLQITSQIPVASGLGSGAAVSAAIVRGLAQQFGRALEDEVVNELVFEVEKLYHGTPSGVDNTVIVYEQPVYFIKGQPIERLVFSGEYRLLIADTGKAALTRVAVGDVRKLYEREPERIQPVLDEIGEVVLQARLALEAGDSLT